MTGLTYSFCYSSQIDYPLSIRVGTLQGNLENVGTELSCDLELRADNKPLLIPFSTKHKHMKQSNHSRTWNEWITLPVDISQLPLSTLVSMNVYEHSLEQDKRLLGGTTMHIFDELKCLKKGRQKLKLWTARESDGRDQTETPGKIVAHSEMDRLEKLVKLHEMGEIPRLDWLDNLAFRQIERVYQSHKPSQKDTFLYIELPRFDHPILFQSPTKPIMSVSSSLKLPKPIGVSYAQTKLDLEPQIMDPEAEFDNPIETKHLKLVRSHRNSPLDRELKPNSKIRDELNEIMNFSPIQDLNPEEKNLVWKFRFYLIRDKRALTKFLKAVVWTDPLEEKQAIELLLRWTEIDVDDALELLGPSFRHPRIRAYAVDRLRKADQDELAMYLLQLVQGLRYEPVPEENVSPETVVQNSSLAQFLVQLAIQNFEIGNNLHWYLMVECEERVSGKLFAQVAHQFMVTLARQPDGLEKQNTLKRQAELVAELLRISSQIKLSKESRPKKIERLRGFLGDVHHGIAQFEPIPLPLDPHVKVVGVNAGSCSVFKSSLYPLKIEFRQESGAAYPIIFKNGDDLRQDQLVMQIITLMDRLLRQENLDLRITPYRILSTGATHGAVQFIPSMTLSAILSENHGSILSYLREHNPAKSDTPDTLGVDPKVMDNYVKSCAGYCVITYLLGVGDRHLDNLMLTRDGRLFHIDFGFILGRDPKPFSPAMKLSREIVDGMGGQNSEHYKHFKSFCYTAFTILRKHVNLILNLFALMERANIPDINIEPEKAVLKIRDRFCLEMNDEDAVKYFQQLINESVHAFLPILIDRAHYIAQYFRS